LFTQLAKAAQGGDSDAIVDLLGDGANVDFKDWVRHAVPVNVCFTMCAGGNAFVR
jgi:hypothetical protein